MTNGTITLDEIVDLMAGSGAKGLRQNALATKLAQRREELVKRRGSYQRSPRRESGAQDDDGAALLGAGGLEVQAVAERSGSAAAVEDHQIAVV